MPVGFVSNKRTRWVGRIKAACQTPSASALGGASREGAISSVGRASRLHRECRRFEPVIAHHFPTFIQVHLPGEGRGPDATRSVECRCAERFVGAEARRTRRCLVRGSSMHLATKCWWSRAATNRTPSLRPPRLRANKISLRLYPRRSGNWTPAFAGVVPVRKGSAVRPASNMSRTAHARCGGRGLAAPAGRLRPG
jgi:hypothetical protein